MTKINELFIIYWSQKSNTNIYWLLGGMHKKGDRFKMPKKFHKRIKAFILEKKEIFLINN